MAWRMVDDDDDVRYFVVAVPQRGVVMINDVMTNAKVVTDGKIMIMFCCVLVVLARVGPSHEFVWSKTKSYISPGMNSSCGFPRHSNVFLSFQMGFLSFEYVSSSMLNVFLSPSSYCMLHMNEKIICRNRQQ